MRSGTCRFSAGSRRRTCRGCRSNRRKRRPPWNLLRRRAVWRRSRRLPTPMRSRSREWSASARWSIVDGLTPGTSRALNRFEELVTKAGGEMYLTSAFRPEAYQQHLRDVWYKWMDELRDNEDPACATLKAQVGDEFTRHQLLPTQHPVPVSDHTLGIGFDAAVQFPALTGARQAPPREPRPDRPSRGHDAPRHPPRPRPLPPDRRPRIAIAGRGNRYFFQPPLTPLPLSIGSCRLPLVFVARSALFRTPPCASAAPSSSPPGPGNR